MTLVMGESIGIFGQRSFWLRCFLGRMLILAVILLSVCGTVRANVCVYRTVYVRSVHGYVVDQTGIVVPSARIVVKQVEYVHQDPENPRLKVRQEGKVVLESTADQQGRFRLKVPRGEYWVNIEANGFAPAHAYVKVGFGIRSLLQVNPLRMRLTVGLVC